jgi:hypothetical protein
MHRMFLLVILAAGCVEPDPGLGIDDVVLATTTTPGASLEILAQDLGRPTSLAVDATALYWVDGDRLERMPRDGGAITVLATGASVNTPWSVAVAGGSVYWIDADHGAIRRTPTAGGATTTLATGQGQPMAIASDGTTVWWTQRDATASHLRRVSVWGGVPTTLATGSDLAAFAVDAWFVYVADAHVLSGANRVLRVPRGGGPAVVLSSDEDALGLAVAGSAVYWTRFWTGDVRRASKWMPGATTIAPDGGGWGDLDVDASSVWWTTGPVVHRAPTSGGAATRIAETAGWANTLVVAGGAVYLAVDPVDEFTGGSIVRLRTTP